MKRTMSKSLAMPVPYAQFFEIDTAESPHTCESPQMIGDAGDVEKAFCNHTLAGGVSL